MLLARRLGALVLAAAAVVIWFLLEPEQSSADAPNYSSAITAAMSDYSANNALADSAPQQDVVNGWVAKDLLEVIAKAENASLSPESAPRDDRIPAELLLIALGVALLALTTRGDGSARPVPASSTVLGPVPESSAAAPLA